MKILLIFAVLFLQACSSINGLSYSNKNISINISQSGFNVNSGIYYNFGY